MAIRFIISLIFAVIVALFAIQNASTVEISILFAKYNISQAIVIFVSAILGAIIVLLLSMVKQIKMNITIKTCNKKISHLEEENKNLKDRLEIKDKVDLNKLESEVMDNSDINNNHEEDTKGDTEERIDIK